MGKHHKSSAKRKNSSPVKTVETDLTGKSFSIKTKTERDPSVDMKPDHNVFQKDCHFDPSASTTERVNLHGTSHPHPCSHPDDVEWETMWLQTAPIRFEVDFDQPGFVSSDSVIPSKQRSLGPRQPSWALRRFTTGVSGAIWSPTKSTHSDDIETGQVHVKIEPDDENTHTPLSTKQETKSISAKDDNDHKKEHTVYPVSLYQNIHMTAHLAENVHAPVISEKCDASDGDTCPHACDIAVQNTSECPSAESSVGQNSHQQTSTSTDRDVGKGTLDTHRMAQDGEMSSVCKQHDTKVLSSSILKLYTQTNGDDKPYMCTQCEAAFRRSSDLKRHTRTHTGDKPFICKQCSSAFNQSSHLKYHIRIHTGDKPYVCKLCDAAYTHSTTLKNHLRTHTGDKPYVCQHCNAAFIRSDDLKRHVRVHTGDKPYACKLCNAAFPESAKLKYHMRTHTGVKPYVCQQCNAAFARSGDLKRHVRGHTGSKPYECKFCEAAFSESTKLKYHIRTHTGDKPYECQMCGAAFAHPNTLKNHIRTHTGDKPYVCTLCDAAFAQSGHLRKHIQKNHTKKQ